MSDKPFKMKGFSGFGSSPIKYVEPDATSEVTNREESERLASENVNSAFSSASPDVTYGRGEMGARTMTGQMPEMLLRTGYSSGTAVPEPDYSGSSDVGITDSSAGAAKKKVDVEVTVNRKEV